jgi:hypothetical protein
MIPYKSPLLTTVPQTLEKRREMLQAIRALAAQDEQLRQRRADIAAWCCDFEALRHDCELFARTLRQTYREQAVTLSCKRSEPRRATAAVLEPASFEGRRAAASG